MHHLVHAGGDDDRLYAQTHWGTYRSDDGARVWNDITEGLPSDFGMVMAAHPHDADVAYVLPLQGAEFRVPPEGKLRVYPHHRRRQDLGGDDEGPAAGGRLHGHLPRGDEHRHARRRPASTSAPTPASSTPAPTRATPGG